MRPSLAFAGFIAVLVAASASFGDDAEVAQPKSPQESLDAMRPRPGFQVELMAAEPLVMDPVAFEWGPDGKFWVVEMADYPLGVDGRGKPGGRVRYLLNNDGDDAYDESHLFLDDLPFPTGVLPWRKGVLVTTAPDIFYAEDTDGDGRADRREVLFTGFAEGNQQHRVNGLVRGLDGWIYCANGDSGGTIKSMKTLKTVDIRGRDFRFKPETGEMEAVAGQTQFGRNRDDFGNWFGCNNTQPMWHFVLDEQAQKRNVHFAAPDPRVQISINPGSSPVFPTSRTLARFNSPDALNRFTSACSAMIYNDPLFGPEFAGNMFVSEPVHNLVHREIVTPRGPTFTSRRADDERESEFLTSTDNWFRPTMIKTGPDGALWIADMYRAVIEHPQWIPQEWQKKLDLRAGHDKGRIYRVSPIGKRPREIRRLDRFESNALPNVLESPSGWERDTALAMIVQQADPWSHNDLANVARRASTPESRVAGLAALDQRMFLTPDELMWALEDKDPRVRRFAAVCGRRLIATYATSSDERAQHVIELLAAEVDQQVVLEAAYSLGEVRVVDRGKHAEVAEALARVGLGYGDDRFVTAAVLSSIHPGNVAAVLRSALEQREQLPNDQFVARLVQVAARVDDRVASTAVGEILLPYLRRAPESDQAGFRLAAESLANLTRFSDALPKLRRASTIDAKLFVRDSDAVFGHARKYAANTSAEDVTRISAIRLLGRNGTDDDAEDRKLIASLLEPRQAPAVRAAAVEAIADLNSPEAFVVMVKGWKSYTPELRGRVLDALLNRPEHRAQLVDSLEQKKLAAGDFDAPRRQRLLTGLTADQRPRAEKLLAGAVNPDRQKVLDAYRPALNLEGNVERGGQLFTKTCAVCHKLRGAGYEVGPDLGAVKDKSPEAMLDALIDPNRAVESRYLSYVAVMSDGRAFIGIITSESGTGLTLRGPEAKEQTVLRANIEELQATGKSLMPEGIEKDLKPQDVADVIAFVRANVAK